MLVETVFGPAGYPVRGPSGPGAMAYLAKRGLFAMEYQAVRSVRIGREFAEELGGAARKNNIVLSLHGPYAVNLSSDDDSIVKASKGRLIKAAVAAHNMGAFHLTFHLGYYGEKTKEEALILELEGLRDVTGALKSKGISVELGPETTGKESQLGSLDEVLELSARLDNIRPTIDFAHIHVRDPDSKLVGCEDFLRVLERVESRLGSDRMNSLVLHFTEVEPTATGFGERKHHRLGSGRGPKFEYLAEALVEAGHKVIVISESPLLDEDALKMKKIYEKRLSTRRGHG